MTKNNLKVHLKWLLDQGPSLYPSLNSSTRNGILFDQSVRADRPVVTSPSVHIPQSTVEVGIEDTANNDPEVKSDVESDLDMGRLSFAPQSASRPRMLLFQNNDASPRISKTPSRLSDEKFPVKPRSSQPKSVIKENHSDLSHHFTSSQRKRPRLKLDFTTTSLDDVDAIDLTGDVEETTSSAGTIEEFSEARKLWAEEVTSRKEPVEKRGKKRKSDEAQPSLLSPTKHASKKHSPLRSPDATSSHYSIVPRPQSFAQYPRVTTDLNSPPTNKDKDEGRPAHLGRSKDVIADSDDEDLDEFDWAFGDHNNSKSPLIQNNDELYPTLPEQTHIPEKKVAPTSSSVKRDTALPSPISASNYLEDRAILTPKLQSHPSPFPSFTGSPDKKSEDLVKFLALPVDSLNHIHQKLQHTRQRNAEIAYEKTMQGLPAHELVVENKALKTRVEALELLKQQKAAYDTCLSKISGLKNLIMQALAQGYDPSTKSEEIAQSKVLTSELRSFERKICELLPQADIFTESPNMPNLETSQSGLAPALPRKARLTQAAIDTESNFSLGTSLTIEGSTYASPARAALPSNGSRNLSLASPICTPTVGENSIPSDMFDDDLTISDDEKPFTRNMGSPILSAADLDEFDIDADEDVMLEAAEHLEGNRPALAGHYEIQGRKAFSEVSGNAARMPSPKKSSTENALWHHPWSKDVKTVLRDRFHLRGFRPNQLEAINATLGGKDTFVLMPTGGGKSLCYQLPSVITSGSTRGLTIVVSPLLSLMQDQVFHLRRLGINASVLNGETSADERRSILNALSGWDPDLMDLLYITPEMINKNQKLIRSLEQLHQRRKLARIVIDEAHCVSQWGHDFRPDYKELGELRPRFLGVPVMALTATATENVKVDVIHNLNIEGCQIFSQSFNRPNLTYEVIQKKGIELLESIADTISTSYRGQSGIVYCLSRKACEKVAADLRQKYRIKASHYHAGMTSDERANVQQQWQSGKCHVMVATIAFGMGIDKPDVRFVIHHSLPKSLEGYYQETGRAGRDGKRSGCYLYYGYKDTMVIKRMIDSGEGSAEQKSRQRQMLRNVVQFCENRSDCRRVQILAYFNEYFRREDCNASCDNCKSDSVFELRDYSEYAAAAVALIRHLQFTLKERVTLLYCVDLFRGFTSGKVKAHHKKLPWFGKGSGFDKGETERLFYHLVTEEALREENVVNERSKFATQYIKIGRRAADFENGRRHLKLHVRVSPNGKSARRSRTSKDDYPLSTNVSSPIQSANQRRLSRFLHRDAQEESSSDDDRDSDGFEPIREVGKPRRERKRELGPPITDDEKLKSLDSLHMMVVEDFMSYAKRECQDIMMRKSLRNQPFPDGILRDMAIRFPKNKDELLAIPGIDHDKVERYGAQFLKLVRDAHRRYEELRRDGNDNVTGIVPDPNHTNVITLSDDDEYADGDELFTDGASFLNQDEPPVSSRYFPAQNSAVDGSPDNFEPGPSRHANTKARKHYTNKRQPRRKPAGSSAPKSRTTKARTKSRDGGTGRSSSHKGSRKALQRTKTSLASIEMMPP